MNLKLNIIIMMASIFSTNLYASAIEFLSGKSTNYVNIYTTSGTKVGWDYFSQPNAEMDRIYDVHSEVGSAEGSNDTFFKQTAADSFAGYIHSFVHSGIPGHPQGNKSTSSVSQDLHFKTDPYTNYEINISYKTLINYNGDLWPVRSQLLSNSSVSNSPGIRIRLISAEIYDSDPVNTNDKMVFSGVTDETGMISLYNYLWNASEISPRLQFPSFTEGITETELTWSLTTQLSTVPIPSAIWLMGSCLLGIIGFSRNKRVQAVAV